MGKNIVQFKCIKKHKNKRGNIDLYTLQDVKGNNIEIDASSLKAAIVNNKINVVNLTLTSNNKLVDSNRAGSSSIKEEVLKSLLTLVKKKHISDVIVSIGRRYQESITKVDKNTFKNLINNDKDAVNIGIILNSTPFYEVEFDLDRIMSFHFNNKAMYFRVKSYQSWDCYPEPAEIEVRYDKFLHYKKLDLYTDESLEAIFNLCNSNKIYQMAISCRDKFYKNHGIIKTNEFNNSKDFIKAIRKSGEIDFVCFIVPDKPGIIIGIHKYYAIKIDDDSITFLDRNRHEDNITLKFGEIK